MRPAPACLFILSALLLSSCGRPSTENQIEDLNTQIAKELTQWTRKSVRKPKAVLLHPSIDPADERNPNTALHAALLKQAEREGIEILAGETVPLSAKLEGNSRAQFTAASGIPMAFLENLLKNHPDANVIISLNGPPMTPPETFSLPVICFDPDGSTLPDLIRKGVVKAAVAPRQAPPPASVDPNDWFAIQYEVVTPDNLDRWWGENPTP